MTAGRPATIAFAAIIVAACAPIRPRVAPPARIEPVAESPGVPAESPVPMLDATPPAPSPNEASALRTIGVLVPVRGAALNKIEDSFDAPRDGGRRHDAVDILAPRGTPVIAATDGTVRRVGTNALGGNVVWVADPDNQFAFYYAHLDRFAKGIKAGDVVRRGTLLGYVGTTGNAPPNIPHLHFQIVRITDPKSWWSGPPVNPVPYLADEATLMAATKFEGRPEWR